MNDETLGDRIRIIRQTKRLTQEQLGERVDVTSAYIGQIERGERTPSIRCLKIIAKELDVSIEALLTSNAERRIILNSELNNELCNLTEEQKRLLIKLIKVLKEW